MPRSISFTFPWFPPEVAPNWTGHHMKKARATKEYRERCGWYAKMNAAEVFSDQVRRFTSPVLATTTFYVKDKRRRDMNNLDASIKALWDGIVDAGILVDDSSEHLRHAESKLVVGKERKVEVMLEEVEG